MVEKVQYAVKGGYVRSEDEGTTLPQEAVPGNPDDEDSEHIMRSVFLDT